MTARATCWPSDRQRPDRISTCQTPAAKTPRRSGRKVRSCPPALGFERSEQDNLEASFLTLNPPGHTRLRKLALPSFSPKAVATYDQRIRQTVGNLLEGAGSTGSFDLVSSFAAALPIAVITDLLGIPDTNAEEFARHGALVGSALEDHPRTRHAFIPKSKTVGLYFNDAPRMMPVHAAVTARSQTSRPQANSPKLSHDVLGISH